MVPESTRVEEDTRELALALLEHGQSDAPWVPDAAFFDDVLLDFCMRHPALKAQLFRFIDVLPALPQNDVTGHLLEYLGSARDDLPAPIRWSFDLTSRDNVAGRIVSRAARRNVLRMARRFIAGTTVPELVEAIRGMRERRLAVTLDALGEAVLTEREADQYTRQYVSLLRDAARAVARLPDEPLIDVDHDGSRLPRVNVSVKLSALTSVFDPIDPSGVERSVVPRFRAILDAAQETAAFVHVDMEQYEKKDLTLAIFREVLGSPRYSRMKHVGIVLQAYLKDAEQDVRELSAWAARRGTPVWVRLVKGAYWDSETVLARQRGWPVPVWQDKWRTDACYERCVDLLLDGAGALRPAFASHNVRSLARALAAARARRLPERFVEFQALFGMADPLKAALVKFGQRVRVYMPFGQLIPGMAYLVRRLLENTSNESFVRRESTDGLSREELERLIGPPTPTSKIVVSALAGAVPSPGATPAREECTVNEESRPFQNEPLQDFSRGAVREAVARAIERVASDLGTHCPVVIDGATLETAERLRSVSPSDARRVLAASACATEEHADRAVAAAKAGLPAWRATPVETRVRVLRDVATLMGARRDELAAWACLEAGKPLRDADADVAEAMDFCRYYALRMEQLASGERSDVPGEENVTVYVPRGPTAVIGPWNFPLAILTGMAAAPLVAGNTVVLKPAEQTPRCGYLVYELFRQAGVPASAIHFLPGRGEVVGARLVANPDVATIAFTGSRAVGHAICRSAAETSTGVVGIKRVVAEMGGKNAIVVDEDADLDEAVPGVLASAFGYAGQKCSACSRVVVVGRAYEPFVERLAEAAAALVTGRAEDPASSLGPLIDAESVERVRRYAEMAERDGRVVFRGALGPGTEHGFFAPPLIVADVLELSPLAQEEVFGPLLVVLHAKDIGHAIAIANGTQYALTAGLYSRSPANIARARIELDAGNVYINRKITGAFVARQPFGGHRHSGTGGKAGGPDYLRHFLDAKTITENTLRRGFAPEG